MGVGHSQPDRPPQKSGPGETGSERGQARDPTWLWVSTGPTGPSVRLASRADPYESSLLFWSF